MDNKNIDLVRDNERALRGALMSTMVYQDNLHRIGQPVAASEKDEDSIIMQNAFNRTFKPVEFPKKLVNPAFKQHSLAHGGYSGERALVNTEYTYKNGVYSPGEKGEFGKFAGALITTSDDPDNPGKKILNVSFRGTDPSKDASAAKYITEAYPDMEKYYHNHFIPLEYLVKEYAKDPKNNISTIDVSGHSLGGAMVHRFVESLEIEPNLNTVNRGVTFGSPGYLSRTSQSVAPKANEVKVIQACAIEDYRENDDGVLKSTYRAGKMAIGAITKMLSDNEASTQRTLILGDMKATQRYSHLDVKQFAHEYDPVTNLGYLEKQRVGEINRLTDYYKQNDYKKFDKMGASILYFGALESSEHKKQVEELTKDFKIPSTDYKYVNMAVSLANVNIERAKDVVSGLWGGVGAVKGAVVAVMLGEEGNRIAAQEIEKKVSGASHSSVRYVKNLFIKSASDFMKMGLTEEEIATVAPIQSVYRDSRREVVAEKNKEDNKAEEKINIPYRFAKAEDDKLEMSQIISQEQTRVPFKVANVDEQTPYSSPYLPNKFADFLKKVEVLSDSYTEGMEMENNNRAISAPVRRI